MSFHKGKFYIAKVDNSYELKTGWIDETNSYGFHKIQKKNTTTILKWVCTDLKSGLKICAAKTRKECCEWVLKNQEAIEMQRNKNEYNKYVDKLKRSREEFINES